MIPDLSISLVSLRRPDLVRQCLESVSLHTRRISYEVHLVAHDFPKADLDSVQARWPALIVHLVTGIRGYSQNNNVALRAARGRYVAILNDDTVVTEDVFGRIVGFLDTHREIAGACPVLRNPDGTVQLGVRGRFTALALIAEQCKLDRLLPAWLASRVGALQRPWAPSDGADVVDIEAGTGACFVARRSAIEAIGFLDEAYFLGPDDIDWTLRLREGVGRVVLLPDASITHFGGSTLSGSYQAVLPAIYAGYYTLLRRHRGPRSEWAVRLLLGGLWSAVLTGGWLLVWVLTSSAHARTMTRARWGCVRFACSPLESPAVFTRLVAHRVDRA